MSIRTAEISRSEPLGHKVVPIALWVVQCLLAVAFGMAGVTKLSTPIAELEPMMPFVRDVPEALVRFIGVSEVLAAVGLVLPALTRIQPRLTPLAAAGLLTIMALATLFHLSRGEVGAIPANVVLGALAGFVVWGRLKSHPIAPRSR